MHSTPISKLLAFLITFTFTLVIAASLPAPDALAAENLQPIIWRGEVNGQAYEVNGTVQQAWAHLRRRFPDAFPESQLKERADEIGTALEGRYPIDGQFCIPVPGMDWVATPDFLAAEGEDHLRSINRRLCMGPNSGCGRISCSWNSAIYWCNPTGQEYCAMSPYIGYLVSDVRASCLNQDTQFTGGQKFDSDGWNVIVKKETDPHLHC